MFIKGIVSAFEISDFKNTHIELKNVESKKITEIEVDSVTGEYYGAVIFRDDYIMTVKKKGYVHESNYISAINPRFSKPLDMFIDLKPIEVGMSYRLNDIYFDFNSVQLKPESIMVMDEFYLFLNENPTLKISIEGHTDNIGSVVDNQVLSENRSKSVYDYLVKRGVPFRKAHGISARVSNYAREKGVPLSQLRVEEYRRFSPLFEEDILALSIEGSVAARDIVGGTAPSQVAEALRAARRALLSTQEG